MILEILALSFEAIKGIMIGFSFVTSIFMFWHMFKFHKKKLTISDAGGNK